MADSTDRRETSIDLSGSEDYRDRFPGNLLLTRPVKTADKRTMVEQEAAAAVTSRGTSESRDS